MRAECVAEEDCCCAMMMNEWLAGFNLGEEVKGVVREPLIRNDVDMESFDFSGVDTCDEENDGASHSTALSTT